jgi:hypothetical protein
MTPFGNVLVAAFCIQTAALAIYAHYPWAAVALWLVSIVLIVRNVKTAGGGMRRRSMHRMRDAVATAIVIGGLLRFFVWQFGGSGDSIPPGGKGPANSAPKSTSTSNDNSGDHTGVILMTEPKQYTTLVPPLPSMRTDLFETGHRNPLTIPFYGAYWFFKLPDRRPPPNSYITHGTPTEISFRAPDHRPLMMEAHQNLGKLIDLSCCSEIRIEIQNADRDPGGIGIELILVNTREGSDAYVSLGRAPVTSVPGWITGSPTTPMQETLSFPIPRHPWIKHFDELMIRFPRDRKQNDRSAKIAIDRFILMPRS